MRAAGLQRSSVPQSLQGFCGRRASEERGEQPREPGRRQQALGLQGAKEERGVREGDGEARMRLKMALGPGVREAREELAAAMTAASGRAGSRLGAVSVPSPFWIVQTPVKKGSQGASFPF